MKKKITGGKRRRGNFKNNKKNDPLISVIMVVLNNQKYLTKSINSVLKQSYKNFELIIIDGGSTDETLKILVKHDKLESLLYIKTRIITEYEQGSTIPTNNIINQLRKILEYNFSILLNEKISNFYHQLYKDCGGT